MMAIWQRQIWAQSYFNDWEGLAGAERKPRSYLRLQKREVEGGAQLTRTSPSSLMWKQLSLGFS
jgi:hypothetical protein